MRTKRKARASLKSAAEKTLAPQLSEQSEESSQWVRLPKEGQTFCGLTRSYLYQLCVQGKIRSVVLAQQGKTRGVRLLSRASILAFIESLDRAQNGEAAQ